MGIVPKAGGYKRLRLVSFELITSFERTEPLSLPLPLPERIQRWCPPSALEDPYRLQIHTWIQVGTILIVIMT